MRFVRTRMRYREQGHARAYPITIARNVCADLQRDRALAWDPLPESLAGSDDAPDTDAAHDLASALARLPRSQREALELRYGQGIKVGEELAQTGQLGTCSFCPTVRLSSRISWRGHVDWAGPMARACLHPERGKEIDIDIDIDIEHMFYICYITYKVRGRARAGTEVLNDTCWRACQIKRAAKRLAALARLGWSCASASRRRSMLGLQVGGTFESRR